MTTRADIPIIVGCMRCYNTGLVDYEPGRGWRTCDCPAGERQRAQFEQAARNDVAQLTRAIQGYYAHVG